MTIIAVIFMAPCHTIKGEHTALYKINRNVYIKTSTNKYIVTMLYFSHPTPTHARTHIHMHMHTHTHRGTQKECNKRVKEGKGVGGEVKGGK